MRVVLRPLLFVPGSEPGRVDIFGNGDGRFMFLQLFQNLRHLSFQVQPPVKNHFRIVELLDISLGCLV
ncbi:hypothetical protein D3C76_1805690 [compost metagenome]